MSDNISIDLDIDEEVDAFLTDFLLAWRARTVEQKQVRQENERRMRDMIRKNRAQQGMEAKKLTIAVTFNKWKKYLTLVHIERREERRLRAEANERLAKAKLKPTKRMLVRRESVLSSRRLSNGMDNPFERSGSIRLRAGSHRGSMGKVAEMAMEAAQNRLRFEEVEIERARYKEDAKTKLGAYKVFRARQMKALSVVRTSKLRLGVAHTDPQFDNDNNRSAFPVPELSEEELLQGQRNFFKSIYEHSHNSSNQTFSAPNSPEFRPITQDDVTERFSPVRTNSITNDQNQAETNHIYH